MFTALLLFVTACSRNSESDEKAVVWVNPPSWDDKNIKHVAFDSPAMGHAVGVSIKLPKGYDTSSKDHPVIYFLHGRGGNETSDVEEFIDFYEKSVGNLALLEPIVVFPNGGLTGYRGDMKTMLIHELIPHIARTYRVKSSPQAQIIAGFSMGGAGAVRLALEHPERFGGTVSWGGGMWSNWDDLLEAASNNAPILNKNRFRALLINGEADHPTAYTPLQEVFEEQSVISEQVILKDVSHDLSQYYAASLETFARFIQSLWSEE